MLSLKIWRLITYQQQQLKQTNSRLTVEHVDDITSSNNSSKEVSSSSTAVKSKKKEPEVKLLKPLKESEKPAEKEKYL